MKILNPILFGSGLSRLGIVVLLLSFSCNNTGNKAISHKITADNYFSLNKYDSALHYYVKSLNDLNEAQSDQHYFDVLSKIITIHFLRNEPELANELINENINAFNSESIEFLKLSELKARYSYLIGEEHNALDIYTEMLARKKKLLGYNDPEVANSYNNIGVVQKSLGNYAQAINSFMKSLRILRLNFRDDHFELATTYINLADAYNAKGDFENAYALLQGLAITISGAGDKAEADYYNILGNVYLNINNLDKAFSAYNKSLEIIKIHFENDYTYLAGLHNNIGNVYNKSGDIEQAIINYNLAICMYNNVMVKKSIKISDSYFNLGNVYLKKSEYSTALEYYGKALRIANKTVNPGHPAISRIYQGIGSVYLYMNNYGRAIDHINKSLTILKAVTGEKNPRIAEHYLQISKLFLAQNYFESSLIYCDKSLELYQKLYATKSIKFMEVLLYKASVYKHFGKLNMAKQIFDQSSKLIRDNLPVNHLLNIKLNNELGHLNIIKSDFEKGKDHYLSALGNNRIRPNDNLRLDELYKMPLSYIEDHYLHFDQLLISLHGITKSLIDPKKSNTNDHQIALKVFRWCDSLNYSRSQHFLAVEDKIWLNNSMGRVYSDAIHFCFKLFSESPAHKKAEIIETALIFSERNRTREFTNAMFSIKEKKGGIISKISAVWPSTVNEPSVSTDQIRQNLDKHEALVEYINYDSVLYAICISKERLDFVRTYVGNEFFSNCIKLYNSINNFETDEFLKLNTGISKKIIDPVLNFISNYNRLIIIPHNQLSFIPFSILLTGQQSLATEFDNLQYLILSKEIVVHYSSTVWLQGGKSGSQHSQQFTHNLVAFAPGFIDQKSLFTVDKQKFSSLPYTLDEIKTINKLYNSAQLNVKSYLNNDACFKNFRLHVNNAKIIHIATHGYVNSSFPSLSYLVFQKPQTSLFRKLFNYTESETGFSEDDILRINELSTIKTNADLVVLSACQTGIGEYISNEGLLSFSRQFILSGASNVVNTLWPVDDKITKDFMVKFYKEILNGKSYSAALQEAKRELISNPKTAHPRNWGGYVLIGR